MKSFVVADKTLYNVNNKGKREAPMAEPSTEYVPPRIEAPYATFSPLQSLGENIPQASYFLSNSYGIPSAQTPYFDRNPANEPNGNDLGQGLNPPPQPYNNIYDGPIPQYANVIPLETAGSNSASYNNYPNNYPNYEGFPVFKNEPNQKFAQSSATFFGNPSFGVSNGSPSTAALVSNQPSYATTTKGLGYYASPQNLESKYYSQGIKNNRPVALQPAHLQRKQPSFLTDNQHQNSFRPSFFLGSSTLTSTSEYNSRSNNNNQPSLTSLGTTNQYISPIQSSQPYQYTSTQPKVLFPPSTSYGFPDTIVYSRDNTNSPIYGPIYGKPQ